MCISCAYHLYFWAEGFPFDSCFYNNPSPCPSMHDPKIPDLLGGSIQDPYFRDLREAEKDRKIQKMGWQINSFGSPPKWWNGWRISILGIIQGGSNLVINLTRIPKINRQIFWGRWWPRWSEGNQCARWIPKACGELLRHFEGSTVSNGTLMASKRPHYMKNHKNILCELLGYNPRLLYRPDYIMRSLDLGICLDSGERKRWKDLASDRASGDEELSKDECGNQV